MEHSHTDDDGALKDGPPQDPGVVAVDGVLVTRLPGLEELLDGDHLLQLLTQAVKLFLERWKEEEREGERKMSEREKGLAGGGNEKKRIEAKN